MRKKYITRVVSIITLYWATEVPLKDWRVKIAFWPRLLLNCLAIFFIYYRESCKKGI